MLKSLQEVLQATLEQACKKVKRSSIQNKAFMIELTLISIVMCNVHSLMNDQDSTWMFQVSGLRKKLLPSLPKAHATQSLVESPAPCLLVSLSNLAPLRPEDFDLILLGPWGIDLIPCLLSLRGWLWITPRELQLNSLHWISCLLRGGRPRVCTTLDTANKNCGEADILLKLQVDSRVWRELFNRRVRKFHWLYIVWKCDA